MRTAAARGGGRAHSEIRADRRIGNPTASGPLGRAFLTPASLDISPPLGDPPRRNLRRSSRRVNRGRQPIPL
jgi:hypothetical protein